MTRSLEKTSIADLMREMHRRGYECYPDDLLVTEEFSATFCGCEKCDTEKDANDRTMYVLNHLMAKAANYTDVDVRDDVTLDENREVQAVKVYSATIMFLANPNMSEDKKH